MIRRSGSNRRYERDRNFGRKSWGVGGPTVLSERAWVRRPTDAVSHGYAHIEEFGEPVETGGSKISSGDSLHGIATESSKRSHMTSPAITAVTGSVPLATARLTLPMATGGVRVTLAGGEKLVVGTQRPEQLARTLRID
jgi:hypothetical protein